MDTRTPRSDSNPRIADRLAAARRQRFVGREAELALLQSALCQVQDDPAAECVVLYVHGPGGVGKTTLLQQFAGLAEEAGRVVLRADARDLQPTPDDLLAILAQTLDLAPGHMDTLVAHWPADGVLVLDSYEPTPSLDEWLRGVFLPCLPARSLVLLAGRHVPAPEWTTDIAWAPLTRIVALRNLGLDDSRRYLSMRGVPALRQAGILAAVHGHPLALSLAADAALGRPSSAPDFDLIEQPNMVRMLLRRLVDEVPSPRHRLALHACATVRLLTQPLLAAALSADDGCADPQAESHAMFEWLGQLACIESSSQGLTPHDLAREVLYADARKNDLDARRKLNARLLGHLYERIQRSEGVQRQRLWFDIIYVQRNNTGMRRYYAWSAAGTEFAEPLRGDEMQAIQAMTLRHEGPASAAIVAHWLRRQPEAFLGFRDLRGQFVGYMANVRLEAATAEDRRVDPAVDRALAYIERHAPARAGEEIAYLRFWMTAEAYQASLSAMNVLAANLSLYWTTRPQLSWSLCVTADADHFEPMFSGLHMHHAFEADFELESRQWSVFAHDWRAETAAQWLAMKVDRASQDEPTLGPASGAAPLLVLSEADFADAVRSALRDFARPDALAASPLLRTRVLAQRVVPGPRERGVEALRALLQEATDSLALPKDRKSLAAIRSTYLEPAPTQEQAAALMGVPFNTYRYQLARGTDRIVQWLWARELGSA